MTPRLYTPENIARALDVHVTQGRMRAWARSGTRYVIHLLHGEDLQLSSHREAWILCTGLAAAARAPLGELAERTLHDPDD